jgi:hypothetical protein
MASISLARSALGNTVKYHPDDHEAIAAARRELRMAVAEKYLARLRDDEDLSPEQRSRLAVLLLAPARAGEAA